MKHLLAVLTLMAAIVPGLAAAGPADNALPDQQAQKEQRRVELRSAMKTQRPGSSGYGAPAPSAATRQLSPQERAELRQQVRQQQGGHLAPVRPLP